MYKNKKIIVACGGVSSEREVSLRSGAAVLKGLLDGGYKNVELFDIKSDNLSELIAKKPDLVFLALHGKGGEDGCIQGALEFAGIPYTGSGVETSAVCMNKVLTKQIMQYFNISTAKFLVFDRSIDKNDAEIAEKIEKELGFPVVLKSPSQGSSIGVVMVKSSAGMRDAIKEIYSYGDILLAEEFLVGREVTLPILGNDELTVLPEVEIISENEFYDYNAKYTQGMCHHIIPSGLSDADRDKIKIIGERLYKILNCRGLARIDFIVDENRGPMVIEVNTLPGMTEMSLFPDSAAHHGISFSELVSRIVELSLHEKQ